MIDKIKEFSLRAASTIIFGSLFIGIFIFSAIIFKWMESVLSAGNPYISLIMVINLMISLIILVPLSLIKKCRKFISGFMLYSFFFGCFFTMELGFLYTYELWGPAGVFIGLFMIGVGIVPTGLIATLVSGEYTAFFNLTGTIIASLIMLLYGYWLNYINSKIEVKLTKKIKVREVARAQQLMTISFVVMILGYILSENIDEPVINNLQNYYLIFFTLVIGLFIMFSVYKAATALRQSKTSAVLWAIAGLIIPIVPIVIFNIKTSKLLRKGGLKPRFFIGVTEASIDERINERRRQRESKNL